MASYKRPAPPSRPGSPRVRFDAASEPAGPRQPEPCRCGSTRTADRPGKAQHWREEFCPDCGRHRRWLAAPLTIEKARNFRLPYGKHVGVPFGTLARTAPDYLVWITEAFVSTPHARRIGQMAALALDDALAKAAKGGRP